MTVAELTERLNALPQEAAVVIDDFEFKGSGDFVALRTLLAQAARTSQVAA